MSKYDSYQTSFTDTKLLCDALTEVSGYTPQVNEQAVHLFGYHGDVRGQTAEIVVPRHQIGPASNDIGFKRTIGGAYQAIISQFDRRVHNDAWMAKLKIAYGVAAVVKESHTSGLHLTNDQTIKTEKGTRRRLTLESPGNLL